ncbi:MAG: TonB-dependent receptor domain-containing protein, partial [Solimonas sp.]
AYAELGYFYSKIEAIGTPSGVRDSGVFNPADPATPVVHRITLPAGHPDNPTGVARPLYYLTADFGGRNGSSKSEVLRAISGVNGAFGDSWTWDLGVGYIENRLATVGTGYVRFSKLQEALNNGTYRLNNPGEVSQSVRDAISPTLSRDAKTSVALVDGKVSGNLFDLPGGPLGVALGAEWRQEKTDTPPNPYTDVGDIIGLGYSAFVAKRDVYATYAEVNAPVVRMLELNAALRYDHYSDFGSSTTPKFGLKFKPIDQLALRATYAEAFRAPGPAESGNSATFGYTGIGVLTTGNPDIKPEKAKSYTAGLIVEPFKGSSVSIDYFKIKRRDEIVSADPALVLEGIPQTGGVPDSVIDGALPNSKVYYNELGNVGTVSAPYQNANKTNTDGFDVDLRQKIRLGEFGTLTAGLNWTHTLSFERQVGDDKLEYAGTHGPYVLSSASGTPRDRATLELALERANWSTSILVNYVGPMDMIDHKGEELFDNEDGTVSTTNATWFADANGPVCGVYNPDGTPRSGCSLSSFTTLDWFGKVDIDEHLQLTGSVQNLLNRMAPFDPYTYGGLNYNAAFHQSGAVGRYFTMAVKYKF